MQIGERLVYITADQKTLALAPRVNYSWRDLTQKSGIFGIFKFDRLSQLLLSDFHPLHVPATINLLSQEAKQSHSLHHVNSVHTPMSTILAIMFWVVHKANSLAAVELVSFNMPVMSDNVPHVVLSLWADEAALTEAFFRVCFRMRLSCSGEFWLTEGSSQQVKDAPMV